MTVNGGKLTLGILVLLSLLMIQPGLLAAHEINGIPVPDPLYVGNITKNPRHNFEERMALMQALKSLSSAYGVKQVKLRFTSDMPAMVRLIAEQKVHVFVDSLYPTVKAANQSGFTVVAEKQEPGEERERFVIFVRKDSGVQSVQDLLGYSLAGEDSESTSTYALPRLYFQSQGLNTTNSRPSAEQIGFDFFIEEINVSRAVVQGEALAGALRVKEWLNPKKMPPAFRQQLDIIYTSEPFTGRVIAVAKDIAPLFSAERINNLHSADFPYVAIRAETQNLIEALGQQL